MWKAERMRTTAGARRARSPRTILAAPLTALALAAALTACSGDDTDGGGGGGGGSEASAEDVLTDAGDTIGDTSGLQLDLTTADLPEGVTGLSAASGVVTSAPAFEGSITVVLGGSQVQVPVVAVDDVVYAQVPLTPGFQQVDPAQYGAPDPAQLLAADGGFVTLLDQTTDLEDSGEERNPDDPSQVLRTIGGTVPGSAVESVIPSAEGDFEASYGFEDGELRTADLTGVFYPDTDPMTYSLRFTGYGTEQDITAPPVP